MPGFFPDKVYVSKDVNIHVTIIYPDIFCCKGTLPYVKINIFIKIYWEYVSQKIDRNV